MRATSHPLVAPGCRDEVPGRDHLSFRQRHIALAPNPHHRYGDLWPVLGEDQAEVGPVDVDRRGQPPRAREVALPGRHLSIIAEHLAPQPLVGEGDHLLRQPWDLEEEDVVRLELLNDASVGISGRVADGQGGVPVNPIGVLDTGLPADGGPPIVPDEAHGLYIERVEDPHQILDALD